MSESGDPPGTAHPCHGGPGIPPEARRSRPSITGNPPAGIALFDLDGTLLPWDCQIVFRHHVVRREPWRGLFLPVFLVFLPLFRLLGDGGMKRVFLSYLWRMPADDLTAHAARFADEAAAHVYPELQRALDAHRTAGHLTILMSASPEFYVAQIGARLGFDLSLGTPVETGPLFPDLENHKGVAKTARLRALLPESWFDEASRLPDSHGYTDSTADLPMLEICKHATLVNPGPELTCIGGERGWNIVRPPRPWKSPAHRALRIVAMLLGFDIDPWHATRTRDQSNV